MLYSVNLLAVVLAAVASFIVGALWHGPLFGKQWMILSGIDPEKMKGKMPEGMGKIMAFAFVQQLVLAFVIAQFLAGMNASSVGAALHVGFLIAFFAAAFLLNGVLWENRSKKLYLFNIAHLLVATWVATLVLVWMS